MYYLYQNATAYVSFSREESFGYAVADAIMFDKPIIARRVGVLTLLDADEKGLYLYDNALGLRNLIGLKSFDQPSYDKEKFSTAVFENKLLSLI